ncbi:hypothetical protein DFP72DRAFT_804695 [Ephemerocybe angulata]|uniref:Uncharacterized protein n=1 Tax=Ephemerocybe angulata TaxID=980116 RepID=A0A8H6I8N8_9AGAR|nr:hypothetical protein DFP72DRAFT_804695 [Tulosesus angulatus]
MDIVRGDAEPDTPPPRDLAAELQERYPGHGPYADILPPAALLRAAEGFTDTSVPFQTEENQFGVYRIYPFGRPSYTPDADSESDSTSPSCDSEPEGGTGPYANQSIALFMEWYHNGKSIVCSKARADDLLKSVLQQPDFRKEDLEGFRVDMGEKALDDYERDKILRSEKSLFPVRDNWRPCSVDIRVPSDKHTFKKFDNVPQFTVEGIMARKILDVISAAFAESSAEYFHLAPYEEYVSSATPGHPPQRQYHELYASDAFIAAHKECLELARHDGWLGEIVVAALMPGSDATLLANFGTQTLWPIYLFLGNLSKHIRAKPSSFSAHHIAYIPKLPDDFQDWYTKTFGEAATTDALSHARLEMFCAVWLLLMDKDLMHAYVHGHDTKFWDEIIRRVYPRFFTYASDYLEKILGLCIKNLSNCPCTRCLTSLSRVDQLGTPEDMEIRTTCARTDDEATAKSIEKARKALYLRGVSFGNKSVVSQLGPKSLRACQNAFSQRLSEHGVNSYDLFAPDLLHEFEIGVYKATLTQELRIAHVAGALPKVNKRFRDTPTYGRGTIRKFSNNVAGMAKFAARDFEDVLQCSVPAFEGILPEPHNSIVRILNFELATWHALAKLRRHSDDTLSDLDASTFRLGVALRSFRDTTCAAYHTVDLPSGPSARRRAQKPNEAPRENAGVKREFNLETYKVHSLGHYANYIRRKGTTDSYSSQHNELEHKRPKRLAVRAARAKHLLAPGIARQQQRERAKKGMHSGSPWLSLAFSEYLPLTDPNVHHQMSHDVRRENKINLPRWMLKNRGDPALVDFSDKLKTHLLLRLLGQEYDSDEAQFTNTELQDVIIIDNMLYRHKVLRVNYTTYDLRRAQDSVNPRTNSDIMILSREGHTAGEPRPHPYWYAKVLAIFHCRVLHRGARSTSKEPRTMEVLWIRWYGNGRGAPFGFFKEKRLPEVGFVDEAQDGTAAFGFLDPSQVIRAVQLIPVDGGDKSNNGLGPSMVRKDTDEDLDWNYFNINIFVDRDMFMRYRGGAPGHLSIRAAVDQFLEDRDETDIEYRAKWREGVDARAAEEIVRNAEDLQNEADRMQWDVDRDVNEDHDDDYGYTRDHDSDDSYQPSDAGAEVEDDPVGDGDGGDDEGDW